jgi:hypothetical protein
MCEILEKRLNWTRQRPQRQHPDGDDAAIALWVQEQFPRIMNEAARREAHLAFVDKRSLQEVGHHDDEADRVRRAKGNSALIDGISRPTKWWRCSWIVYPVAAGCGAVA